MTSNHNNDENNNVRVELKYCEHCGSLWVRAGSNGVYCEECQPKVADLPTPTTKRPARLILPVRPHTAIEDYEFEIDLEDLTDFEAAGGVA